MREELDRLAQPTARIGPQTQQSTAESNRGGTEQVCVASGVEIGRRNTTISQIEWLLNAQIVVMCTKMCNCKTN